MKAPDVSAIIGETRSWCGTPYRHQASLKGVGADCLGLLRGVYQALYGHAPQAIPAYGPFGQVDEAPLLLRAAQTHLQDTEAPLAAGQVLLFQLRHRLPPRHVGIAVSDDTMVHALAGVAVCEVQLRPWWRRHCVARFVFPKIDIDEK